MGGIRLGGIAMLGMRASLLLLLTLASSAHAVWPSPASSSSNNGTRIVKAGSAFFTSGLKCSTLAKAASRYVDLTFPHAPWSGPWPASTLMKLEISISAGDECIREDHPQI